MKKNKFILMLLMLSFSLGGLISCQADSENILPAEELTAADVFVASEKYQNYLKVKRKDLKKMNKILSTLASEERNEYNRLRYLVPKDEEEFNEIVQTINAIIGIDYKSRLMKLFELEQNTFQNTNFTQLELLQAQQRYNVLQSTIPRTRGYEERVRDCQNRCDAYGANCPSARPPWDFHYDKDEWRERMECLNAADAQRDKCYSNCY